MEKTRNLREQEKQQATVTSDDSKTASIVEGRHKSQFIDLTRDIGFKIVMADPDKPQLMMQLLNELIPEREIVSITFLDKEAVSTDEDYHSNNYDIQCVDKCGNRFIVEMQKQTYHSFSDRLMVYSGDPLMHLLKKGEKYDNVRTLYMICILGGHLYVKGDDKAFRHRLLRRAHVSMDDSRNILSDKLNFIFLQLSEAEEPTDRSSFLERWAYYVRTMGEVESKPEGLAPYFNLLFDALDRSNIEEHKLSIYDDMVRDEIQIEAEKEYAIQEALEEKELEMTAAVDAARSQGLQQGMIETARNMKAVGITEDIIGQCTGLTMEQIAEL